MVDLIKPTSKNGNRLQVLKHFIDEQMPYSLPIYKTVQDLVQLSTTNNNEFNDAENTETNGVDHAFLDSILEPRIFIQSYAVVKPNIASEHRNFKEGIHLNIHLFTAEDTSKSIQNVLCILLQKILFLCRQKFQITTRENIPIVQVRFPALSNTLLPFMTNFFEENHFSLQYQEKCNLWVLDEEKRTTFQNQMPVLLKQQQRSEEDGGNHCIQGRNVDNTKNDIKIADDTYCIELKPLSTREDAELVNSTWKYRSDESLSKILKIIHDQHPTVGLYINNKLVSWAVTYPDGASGMLYTLESYRRKGYAKIVMQQLFYYRSISNTNYGDPFDFIVINNVKSENLFKKLNFKPIKKVDWVAYKIMEEDSDSSSNNNNNRYKWDNYFENAIKSNILCVWESGKACSKLHQYLIENSNDNTKQRLRAIDVGCGSGYNTQLLSQYYFSAAGLDISRFALIKARLNMYQHYYNDNNNVDNNNVDLPSNIEFILGDLFNGKDMEKLNDMFHFLFDLQVYHALRNLGEGKLVKAFAKLLVVGGYCMIICGDAGDAIEGQEKKVGPSIVSKFELIKAFSPYFDLISIEHEVFDTTASYKNFPCIVSVWKKRKVVIG
jgi:SAM-dependent methyltransferase